MGSLFDDMEAFKRASMERMDAIYEDLNSLRLRMLERAQDNSNKHTLGEALLDQDAKERAPEVPLLPDHPRFQYTRYQLISKPQFDLDYLGTWVDIVNLKGANLENCIAIALRYCAKESTGMWVKLEQRLEQ